MRQLAVNRVMNAFAQNKFEYGSLDCCQFAARVAKEITGVDYSAGFEYDSETDAQHIIDQYGSFEEMVTSIIGKEPVAVSELTHGDPLILNLPTVGRIMGIYATHFALCKTTKSVSKVPLRFAEKGWRLG